MDWVEVMELHVETMAAPRAAQEISVFASLYVRLPSPNTSDNTAVVLNSGVASCWSFYGCD